MANPRQEDLVATRDRVANAIQYHDKDGRWWLTEHLDAQGRVVMTTHDNTPNPARLFAALRAGQGGKP